MCISKIVHTCVVIMKLDSIQCGVNNMWQCKHCDAHIDIKMHDNYLVKAYNVLETFIIIFIFYKIHIFMPKIIWGENSMLDTGCKKQ